MISRYIDAIITRDQDWLSPRDMSWKMKAKYWFVTTGKAGVLAANAPYSALITTSLLPTPAKRAQPPWAE